MGVEVQTKGSAAILLPESFLHSDRDLEIRRKLAEHRMISEARIIRGFFHDEKSGNSDAAEITDDSNELDDDKSRVLLNLELDATGKMETFSFSHWISNDLARPVSFSRALENSNYSLAWGDLTERKKGYLNYGQN